jgi:hypothetical protein
MQFPPGLNTEAGFRLPVLILQALAENCGSLGVLTIFRVTVRDNRSFPATAAFGELFNKLADIGEGVQCGYSRDFRRPASRLPRVLFLPLGWRRREVIIYLFV